MTSLAYVRKDQTETQNLGVPAADNSRRPILAVLHNELASTGYVGHALKALGYSVDIRRPCLGDTLPKTLETYSGVVIFGGMMSVNDDLEYIRRELNWIEVVLSEQKPFLGICLGAQLLAKHLGAKVSRDPEGQMELGYYPIRNNVILHDDLLVPEQVLQWHNEGFSLPSDCDLICEGLGAFENQAFRYGETAFGLQFHPEATIGMLVNWLDKNPETLETHGEQTKDDILETHITQSRMIRDWLKSFLVFWLTKNVTQQDISANGVSNYSQSMGLSSR